MAFKKKAVAIAVLVGMSSAAMAQHEETDKQSINFEYALESASGAAIVSQEGMDNVSVISQEGDRNVALEETAGDENFVSQTQAGFSNQSTVTVAGDLNAVVVEQVEIDAGLTNLVRVSLNGSENQIDVAQAGSGLYAFVEGVEGDMNQVMITQTDRWSEARIRGLQGDFNMIDATQTGFYNIAQMDNFVGSFANIVVDQAGDLNEFFMDNAQANNLTVNARQEGGRNSANATVASDMSVILVTQNGERNTSNIQMLGAADGMTGMANTSVSIQNGNDNEALALIAGDRNTLSVNQIGDVNVARAAGQGSGTIVNITQVGSDNLSTAGAATGAAETVNAQVISSQNGDLNQSFAIVYGGADNAIQTTQDGTANEFVTFVNRDAAAEALDGNLVVAEQVGEVNIAEVIIEGANNDISISQTGGFNVVSGEEGVEAGFFVGGSDNALTVIQNGELNAVYGYQVGSMNTASVTQTGIGNTATIMQN